MKAITAAVLLLGSSLMEVVSAGGFSDRVMERYKRPEKFAPKPKARSLQERQANFRYLTNDTQRKLSSFPNAALL